MDMHSFFFNQRMDFRAEVDLSSAVQRTNRGENESKQATGKAAGRASLRLREAEQKGDSCHQGVKRSEHGVGGTGVTAQDLDLQPWAEPFRWIPARLPRPRETAFWVGVL